MELPHPGQLPQDIVDSTEVVNDDHANNSPHPSTPPLPPLPPPPPIPRRGLHCLDHHCDYHARNQHETKLEEMDEKSSSGFQGSLWRQIGAVLVVSSTNFLQGSSLPTASLASAQLSLLTRGKEELCDRNVSNPSCLEVQADQDGFGSFPFYASTAEDTFRISEHDITFVEISWLLGHLVSAVTSNPVAEIIGRKKSLVIDVIVFMCGFLLMAWANSVLQLCIGRLLLGYPLVSSVYLCELVHPDLRGVGGALYATLNAFGYSLTLLLGAVLPSWRQVMLVLALCHIPVLLLIYLVPESPAWLLRRGREAEAETAFTRIRGPSQGNAAEFARLKRSVDRHFKADGSCDARNILRSMKRKKFLMPFSYLVGLYIGIGWSGFAFIAYNSIQLFQNENLIYLDKYYISFLVSMIKIPGGFTAMVLMNFLPRSIVFQSTGVLVALSHFTMGLVYLGIIPNVWAVAAITCAFFGYTAGYVSCSNLLLGELLPANLRSIGVGLISATETLSALSQSLASETITKGIGHSGLFFLFGGVVVATLIHSLLLMPRTTGLTLEEIETGWLDQEEEQVEGGEPRIKEVLEDQRPWWKHGCCHGS